ncbi:hypothetical protein [Paenibacillus sp. PvR148]
MKPHRESEELRTDGLKQRKMVLEDMKVSRWNVRPSVVILTRIVLWESQIPYGQLSSYFRR